MLLKESRRIDLENKKSNKRLAHKIGDSFSIFYFKRLKELIDSGERVYIFDVDNTLTPPQGG